MDNNAILEAPASSNSESYKNFINTVDSEVTKRSYRYAFSKFMEFCGLGEGDYDKVLQIESKKLERLIRDYIIHLKVDKKLSFNSIHLYVSSITHFFQMNDVVLNWKKLVKFMGNRRLVVEDKPYSVEQIRQLLDFSDLRLKCIITLMYSAGLRRGGIPNLTIGDLKKIEKYGLYKISVYRKETEAYNTYCSPECASYLDQYFDWRSRLGEKLTSKSPVIRREFTSLQVTRPLPLSVHSISWLMNDLLDRSGIRPRSPNKLHRTDVMQCHGLRKAYETTAKIAGMDLLFLNRCMGHDTGLEESYFKPTDEQILEGNDKNIGYIGIVDSLTINSENRLKREIKDLQAREVVHCAEWESIRQEIGELRQKFLKK